MRIVFALLVIANLAFFGYVWVTRDPAQREPAVMDRQMDPAKIHLLSADEAAAKVRAANRLCIEWGPFLAADEPRAENDLGELAQGAKITQRRVEEPSAWWVYLPPLATPRAGNQRVAELKRMGFTDVAIMPADAKMPHAISLGVFSSEEAAIRRQAAFAKKNVKNVQIQPRDGVPKTYLQLRGGPDGARARMIEMKANYSGTEVQDCPQPKPADAKAADATKADADKSGDAAAKSGDAKAADAKDADAKAADTKAANAKAAKRAEPKADEKKKAR